MSWAGPIATGLHFICTTRNTQGTAPHLPLLVSVRTSRHQHFPGPPFLPLGTPILPLSSAHTHSHFMAQAVLGTVLAMSDSPRHAPSRESPAPSLPSSAEPSSGPRFRRTLSDAMPAELICWFLQVDRTGFEHGSVLTAAPPVFATKLEQRHAAWRAALRSTHGPCPHGAATPVLIFPESPGHEADTDARFYIPIVEFTFLLRPRRDGHISLASPLLVEFDDPTGTVFLYRPLGLHRAALFQLLSVDAAYCIELSQ